MLFLRRDPKNLNDAAHATQEEKKRRFFVVFAFFAALIFVVSCGGNKKEEITQPDNDQTDADTVDDGDDKSRKQGELYGECYPNKTCNEDLICDEENNVCIKNPDNQEKPDEDSDSTDPTNPTDPDDEDNPITPDEDTDTDTEEPEVTENHKISGILQAGSAVSGVKAALVECGQSEEIASANTDSNGKFSFNADIAETKTYCVKAGDFASCFKGMSDHIANISEITNAAYLVYKNCADLRKSETKVRAYTKLGTGKWLGELDYSKLSGIKTGLKLLSSYLNTTDSKTISEKIAADIQKTDGREFDKFFNGFRISADKKEVVIDTANTNNNEVSLNIEGGSCVVAEGFKIVWTALNKTEEAATHKFKSVEPGEYTVRAKLVDDGGNPIMISEDSSTILFLLEKSQGTIDVRDTSKDISHYIDHGIYVVIPKNTEIKKDGNKVDTLTYTIMMTGDGSQISKIDFAPEGTTFTGDSLYFVYELGTVFGGDPIMLSAARSNGEVLQSAGGDPIMLAAAGDPIMFSAAGDPIMHIARSAGGDPIMQSAAGDPIMTSAAGDPIMTSAAGDPIMNAAAGDPIMTSAAGDPIMNAAAGDPIMLGTSSSVMIAKTEHFSGFMLNSTSLPVSAGDLISKWCGSYYYQNYSPVEFIKRGIDKFKPEGAEKTDLLNYFRCPASEETPLYELESDLYELFNKPIGYKRNINLIENIYYISEFYNRMLAKRENGEVAAAKNGLELRSAIASLFTSTDAFNRNATLSDIFDSSNIPLTYSGSTPADYSADALEAVTGLTGTSSKYAATKKEMMIFANYIMTSSNGPDFSGVSQALNPDQFVCAWFTGTAENCSGVYTLNENGRVALNGTEITLEEAEQIFAKFFMPMNSRLSESEKLNLFKTYYLSLKYAGTIFANSGKVAELNDKLLETAYLVFDGINKNKNAVTIVDTFDASAHTVFVFESGSMETKPYLDKLSSLTDLISLNAATSANVEKVLIKIEGKEFDKVTENTRTYYKPKGELKEKSIILTPGNLAAGLKPLKDLIGSNNVDVLGNIAGKMTVVVNSKISGKTYSTQKTYEFLVNSSNEGVDSKPVPSNLAVLINDATGHAIALENNPGIILNPGNRTFYPDEFGEIKITNLTPASYTITAFADGYYTKNAGVNLPENATIGVEIRLDEEITSSHADANLTLKVNINTVKHPEKVYIQIYDEDMELVTNESTKYLEDSNGYKDINVGINFGRYTLLAVGEEMYNYLEAITVNDENTVKEITVVAKNACGNGIIDAGEECETGDSASTTLRCKDVFHASTNPDNEAVCNRTKCVYDKAACGAQTYSNCGDGIIDPGEGCDGGTKACSEILGINVKGTASCKADCLDWVTAGSCTKTTAECGERPANTIWNDGTGRFTQTYNGYAWLPATKEAAYGTTREECFFSCEKGYKWDSLTQQCLADPLSLGNICTGQESCFDNGSESECPVYGSSLFGQDAQYAAVGYCTPQTLTAGENGIVTDGYTHYEWQQASSDEAMDWTLANKYCSDLNNEGTSSVMWRLPAPDELLTIVDSGSSVSALADIFTAASGRTFWSGTDNRNSEKAWRINENGALESVEKTTENYVLCVRINDYAPVENRFSPTPETVTDNVSGLIWQTQYASSKSWGEALKYCEDASTDGHFDWRLPNRNELASLIDFTRTSDAASGLSSVPAQIFWTSTSSITEAAKAWTVDFADGSISAETKSGQKYVLCVRSENICLGDESECVDACDFEPCRNTENSTGVCTATGGTFYCGCKTGFEWNSANAKCIQATTRYAACTGLPENAKWNTVSGISQIWNGNEWYPDTKGEYNETASTKECRFICDGYFEWDTDRSRCINKTQLVSCGILPYANTEWTGTDSIIQIWNGEEWLPKTDPIQSDTAAENECRFKCKEHYNWNAESSNCDPETQEKECTTPPANTEWNTVSQITQTWNGIDWEPSNESLYSQTPSTSRCYFKCKDNHEWLHDQCEPKKQPAYCVIPEHSVYNTVSSIIQTWNETNHRWEPSEIAYYNETPSTQDCRYKCVDGYFYSGSECVSPCENNPCDIEHSTGACTATAWNEYSCGCDSGYFWKDLQCKKSLSIGNICTNQTKCYNTDAYEISCPNEGEDFYGQDAQYAALGTCTPQSFTVKTISGDNIVFDNNTGLQWQQAFSEEAFTWDDALTHCENLTYAGYSDWRLPSPMEFHTISDLSRYNPSTIFDATYFPNIPNKIRFWTSQEYKPNTSKACYVDKADSTAGYYTKTSEYNVMCVRGSELPRANFTTSEIGGDIVVTDSTTGLMWQKAEERSKTWQQALADCENLTYAGYSDWRLPNRNESLTLLNYDKTDYPYSDFPDIMTTASQIWSSSAVPNSQSQAFTMLFYNGHLYHYYKSKTEKVLCVRSETQQANCTDLPANAQWNSVSSITQYWHGTSWYPSTSGVYNEDASTEECRFKCLDGYFWDGEECVETVCITANPCIGIQNGNVSCSGTLEGYICGCNENYAWNGEKCVETICITANPCIGIQNGNGSCFGTFEGYTCGCNKGYAWNGSQCIVPLGKICTGQTKCYNNTEEISCPAVGVDFYGQDAQYAALGKCTPQSFTVHTILGDNIVFDNNTGLQWQQTFSENTFNWDNARTHCENLTYGGYSDWRLPTPVEIQTISDQSRSYPGFDTTYFTNITNSDSSRFWTSQERKADTTKAYFARYLDSNYTAKTTEYNVMCVRGDELPGADLTASEINGDVVVTDSTTGLMWQKTYEAGKTWQEALSYCENLTYAGFNDWRLPNRNESATLLNYDKTDSPYSDFPDMPSLSFLSSSTNFDNSTNKALYTSFEFGTVSTLYNNTTSRMYVRCVRNAD